MYDEYREVLKAIIQEGIHQGLFRSDIQPYYVASIIFGALDGIMLQWIMMDPDEFSYREAIEALLDALFKGIKS